ncbi:ABC_ATPase domain containing protein [uncultured Caudovirales phage]|uniref:ABC_ATPase domain containing protein n=1 Tax=uncultured Caudovirales phage TaxID=2100421 RepID=A0A6J5NZK7_9CAUD|nr:ABC_ATPase domain containing protein [uncultured Caudovirales phage]
MFDMPADDEVVSEWRVDLPVEDRPWSIGLIVGASGSGKTTVASEVFADAHFHTRFKWDEKAALVDGFPKALASKDIVEALSSVGLSSPPHWIKPFGHLSNGQQFRAELARLLVSGHPRVVFDEFTSVVDRDVARVCCAALSKTIRRRQRPQFVAVSCHFDIIDWLQPDWVFDVSANRFEWRSLRRRPPIIIDICESSLSAWNVFREHHYLSANINRAAKCFTAYWNGKPVGFTSYLHLANPIIRNVKREHRTVVLPDYQGVGIGNTLSEFIAEYALSRGFRFMSTTSHPAMIAHRRKSPLWRCHRFGYASASRETDREFARAVGRRTAGFEYVGGGVKQ